MAFSDEGVLGIEVPLLATGLQPNTLYDWNYTTTPQSGLGGRNVVYPRGRVLGGSSSISESMLHIFTGRHSRLKLSRPYDLDPELPR